MTVRHCTFVPGWTIHHDCEPESPDEPSIELVGLGGAQVTVEYSIVGPIDVLPSEHAIDPVAIAIADSIVDATHVEGLAVRSTGGGFAHAVLSVVRATVIGVVRVHAVELGENSIFFGVLTAARRQFGCVRFCWVEPDSRTPRRYHCQPDLVVDAAKANALGPTAAAGDGARPAAVDRRSVRNARVLPARDDVCRRDRRAVPMTNPRWACTTTSTSRNGP